LVSLDENAANPIVAVLMAGGSGGYYDFHKGRDCCCLFEIPGGGGQVESFLVGERVSVRNTNVVMALALTRVDPDLVITIRVLDKADPNTVLYQRAVVDTPGADPSLTAAQVQALTGRSLTSVVPDSSGPPLTQQFQAVLGVCQYTAGNQPRPRAVLDNLELRTSEIPPVGIEGAMRLSWPASTSINYAVEGAPTVQGPWLPEEPGQCHLRDGRGSSALPGDPGRGLREGWVRCWGGGCDWITDFLNSATDPFKVGPPWLRRQGVKCRERLVSSRPWRSGEIEPMRPMILRSGTAW
jgi:hypothetical protein